MLAIGGRPLLDIWLGAFARAGVTEVMVNLHHLPDVVRRHIEVHHGRPTVRMVYEPELLGSAGTLLANRQWVAGEASFLVCNSDNLTDFDLRSLIDVHARQAGIATLAVFRSPDPSSGGVVETDETGRLSGFTEKPSRPVSDLTNAGMYVFHPDVLDKIDAAPPRDIGYDLLPRLVGHAWTVLVDGYFRDIGTPETYRLALQEWPARGAGQRLPADAAGASASVHPRARPIHCSMLWPDPAQRLKRPCAASTRTATAFNWRSSSIEREGRHELKHQRARPCRFRCHAHLRHIPHGSPRGPPHRLTLAESHLSD
jgi:mannose-1-phosphate guanylyltransferase